LGLNKSFEYVHEQLKPYADYYTRLDQPWVFWPGVNRSTHLSYKGSNGTWATVPMHDIETASWVASANISAVLIPSSNYGCSLTDYPPEVRGQVAFVRDGNCTQYEKSLAATQAGAAAAVTCKTQHGPYLEARLGGKVTPYPGTIPISTVGVNGKPAETLMHTAFSRKTPVKLLFHNTGVPQDRTYT
jgi:hypothetical protein